MTKPSEAVYSGLKRARIDFTASVPCVNLGELIALLSSDPGIISIPATREEEGIGLCAGAYLGGKRPALLMQNSGLGNSINALASLDILYKIPLLMIISHRGVEGENITAQVPMGQLTQPLLNSLSIRWLKPGTPDDAEWAIKEAWDMAKLEGRPTAVLLDISYWKGSQ